MTIKIGVAPGNDVQGQSGVVIETRVEDAGLLVASVTACLAPEQACEMAEQILVLAETAAAVGPLAVQ